METSAQRVQFRSAFDAHFDALNRYCLRRVPIDDVNDVVSEVFLVAWRKIDHMPAEPDCLMWLYGVARFEVNNRRRSNRRSRALAVRIRGVAHHPDPEPETVIIRREQSRLISKALSTLRPLDQEILLLRTHEELSYDQISIVVGCNPQTARKRMARALRRLRAATDTDAIQRVEAARPASMPEGQT